MWSAMCRNPVCLLLHSTVDNGCSLSVVFRVYDSDGNEYLDSQVLTDIYLLDIIYLGLSNQDTW